MASTRGRQIIGRLPDVMSKSAGIALTCSVFRYSDRAEVDQAELLAWNKQQIRLDVEESPAKLIAIGPVESKTCCVENPRRNNFRFRQRNVLGPREAVHTKRRILRRTTQDRAIEGISYKEGIG